MKNEINIPKAPSELNEKEREAEIFRLERERENINNELEDLVRAYAKLIGDQTPTKGARPRGAVPNDWSYWHK